MKKKTGVKLDKGIEYGGQEEYHRSLQGLDQVKAGVLETESRDTTGSCW